LAPHRSSEFLAVLVGSGAGCPVAHHPAKVSSSSAAVPHHCGLLPSCRSSPLAPSGFRREIRGGFVSAPRRTDALRVDGVSPSGGVGRGVSSAPSNVRRVSKHRHRLGSCFQARGSTSGSGPPRSSPSRGRVRGALRVPLRGRGDSAGISPLAREVLLDLRSPPLPVSGSRRVTEDSLARWLSGPPEILGIPGDSVVPSPSVDTRSGVSAGRLQGLAPPTSPGRSAGLATHGPPVPSLGLFPLRGSTRATDGSSLRILRPPRGLPSGHPGPGFHSARVR